MSNIYHDLNVPSHGETFEELLSCKNVRVERIISSDEPEQTDYNQDHDEWVLVLRGSAVLATDDGELELNEGEHLFIPRGTRHRVVKTERETVWLAVHIE